MGVSDDRGTGAMTKETNMDDGSGSMEFKVPLLLNTLKQSRLKDISEWCGADASPGKDEAPEWRIWISQETTPDQKRIEEYLSHVITKSTSILHIGVGNSSLAVKYASQIRRIRGTSIHTEEKIFAQKLNIPNYEVSVVNKYSKGMFSITGPFDFIVDNNPSTFSCCLFHFCRMMVYYAENLREGGAILTAQPGLGWVITGVDPNWSLNWDDWMRVGEALKLRVREVDDLVYSMERSGDQVCEPNLADRCRHLFHKLQRVLGHARPAQARRGQVY
jgi:hypothetical protein